MIRLIYTRKSRALLLFIIEVIVLAQKKLRIILNFFLNFSDVYICQINSMINSISFALIILVDPKPTIQLTIEIMNNLPIFPFVICGSKFIGISVGVILAGILEQLHSLL